MGNTATEWMARSGRDEETGSALRYYSPWGKYDSPMSAYLESLYMDGAADEDSGSVEWEYHAARFGRRVLCSDDRGFVWSFRCATEETARRFLTLTSWEYAGWEEMEEESETSSYGWRMACAECEEWGEPRQIRETARSDGEWHHANRGHECFVISGELAPEDLRSVTQ